jgi:hypothetical protein
MNLPILFLLISFLQSWTQVESFVGVTRMRIHHHHHHPKTDDATTASSSSTLLPYKPATHLEIEKENGEAPAAAKSLGAVQGMTQPAVTVECHKYASELTNATKKHELQSLTEPRDYSLFLMEKAAKVAADMFPRHWQQRDSSSLMRSSSAAARAVGVMVNGHESTTTSTSSSSGSSPTTTTTKERLVILGTGWGAAALLPDIDNDMYHVTVISPRNYFLFTPMLAGASVGTVDVRSITEPIRAVRKNSICIVVCTGRGFFLLLFLVSCWLTIYLDSFFLSPTCVCVFQFNRHANYLEARASSIDTSARTISCQGVLCSTDGACEISEFAVPYDRLVVAVGARTNTFGITGVSEHCFFLKQVEDARESKLLQKE